MRDNRYPIGGFRVTRFTIDLLERVAATYAEAFVGLLIASGFGIVGVADLSTVGKAAVSAIPAGLSALKAGLATLRGNPDSASLADLEAHPVAPPAG